jgi:hypothetical protein
MLHDGFEAGALKAFLCGVRGFLVGERANLHVIILVGLRGSHEGGEFFLLQMSRESQGVGFAAQRSDLQSVGARGNRREAETGRGAVDHGLKLLSGEEDFPAL